MSDQVKAGRIIGVSLLNTGNLIGAGILALPVNTGLAGFVPALAAMLVLGRAMFFSAMALADETCRSRQAEFNYPSLYGRYLGPAGKWVAIGANLLLLHGIMTAYLTGGAVICGSLLGPRIPPKLVLVRIFGAMTSLSLGGMGLIEKYNSVLTMLMLAAFAAMVAMDERCADPARFRHFDWLFLPAAAPIIVTAFNLHNIIPTVSGRLGWNRAPVIRTIGFGMMLGFIMNTAWIQVGIGALPLADGPNSLLAAFRANQPATVRMSKVITSPGFALLATVFALLAIATSYLANGVGLQAFITDLTANHINVRLGKHAVALIAFGPPLAVAIL